MGRDLQPASPSGSPRLRGVDPLSLVGLLAALALWEACGRFFAVPAYVLPVPSRIATTLVQRWSVIAPEALVTLGEILCGFAVGAGLGLVTALAMSRWRALERLLGPLLVVSQALPVFAIAPVLVVWFGFGLASKVAMATVIIFFPVAANALDGLRRTDPGLVELARLYGASPRQTLFLIRGPAALPAVATGLRIAAAAAPIGAVVGEWVGSSAGLGLLILHANARSQTDMVFAALAVLAALSVTLWTIVDRLLRRLVRWAPDTLDHAAPGAAA
ncbi:ABC transporter permease [Alsobacter soli]|uniref:ABC transporter permease n=1 Tax=Alsobacter soli TaxID=2109933 RepID=A0A2T1HQI6_9HYPH|nr:ABC transporter permease [Alsobacter soli]PSC03896.1 ABC transporter permease [Alsobacter soli]